MILATGCLASAALDGAAICATLERLKLQRVLLSVDSERRANGLEQVPAVAVRCGLADKSLGIAAAAAARARRLVLDLPDDFTLEQAARCLHGLSRGHPGLQLALATPADGPLADIGTLELLFDDLARHDLRWWHVPSRCHRAGVDPVLPFDRLGSVLCGLSLDDVRGGQAGLPPGLGELDLAQLAELTGQRLEVTLDVDPLPDPVLLTSAITALLAAGFR